MSNKVTSSEIFSTAKSAFLDRYGGKTCMVLAVLEPILNSAKDFYQGAITGWFSFGKSAGIGILLAAAIIIFGFILHVWYAPITIAESERKKNSELQEEIQKLRRVPSDVVEEFKKWIVRKSTELIALKTEVQFWRWKESMLTGIRALIRPEYSWDDQFSGTYDLKDGPKQIVVVPFSQMLIDQYEQWLEGMRKNVSDEHIVDNPNLEILDKI